MKNEYKELIKEEIVRLINLKEDIVNKLQEVVNPCMDFPCDNYNLSKFDIDRINVLRNKEVAIYELISMLDKELHKSNEEVL